MKTLKKRWFPRNLYNKSNVIEVHFVKEIPELYSDVTGEWNASTDDNDPIKCVLSTDGRLFVSTEGNDPVFANEDSSWMFMGFENISIIDGLEMLDTRNVKSMHGMFEGTGFEAPSFAMYGLANWDVSNVLDMACMFKHAGYKAKDFKIDDLTTWNTKSVQNMGEIFMSAGHCAEKWFVGNLSQWDIANVRVLDYMFAHAGDQATVDIGDISKWDMSHAHSKTNFMFDPKNRFNLNWE